MQFNSKLCASCILAEDNEAFIYFHGTGYSQDFVFKTFRYIMGNPDRRAEWYTENSLLSIFLSLRGYPHDLVMDALKSVNKMEIKPMTESENKKVKEKLILILDHNPRNPDVLGILNKYWPILDRSSSTRKLLDYDIMIAYRKPKSLMDHLCSTDLKETTKQGEKNFSICRKPGSCTVCPKLNKTGSIISNSTKRKYKCVKKFSCKSENVIYCIECKTCGHQYVGQTKNQLKFRIHNHLSNIRTKSDTPIGRHFNTHPVCMNIYVLQLMRTHRDDLTSWLSWENTWIARLNTLTPKGMNIMDWWQYSTTLIKSILNMLFSLDL